MGKFVYAVLMVFLVEMALWLFGGADYSQSSLFNLISNPSTIASNPLYLAITVALAAFGVAAIVPGNYYQRYISILYVGLVVIFVGFAISLTHLWTFLNGQLEAFVFGDIITILIIAPFLITYILACVEWVRSNQ